MQWNVHITGSGGNNLKKGDVTLQIINQKTQEAVKTINFKLLDTSPRKFSFSSS